MSTLKNFGIIGMGKYTPERIMTNFDLEKIVETSDEWIQSRTGIQERRIAAPEQACSDLAANAALAALKNANVEASEIDLIIVATATPDHLMPSTAAMVQKKIGATKAAAFDLEAACSGFVYSLVTGGNFIATGMYKKVLVIGAEVFSRFLNWEDRNTCVLFGDGAAAAVLSEQEEKGFLGAHLAADGDLTETLQIKAGGSRLPMHSENIENKSMFIEMKGQEVYKFAVKALPKAIKLAAENANIEVSDLDIIVPHQANQRIIDAAAKRLKYPSEKFVSNLHKYGNTSAASIGIALTEAIEESKVKKGDTVALVGFGAGLTYASCVLKWGY